MTHTKSLGGFEHVVMLAIRQLGDGAYGVPIRRFIVDRTGRDISVGALYTTLDRLERKGLVSSYADATPSGRPKRSFRLEGPGIRALQVTEAELRALGGFHGAAVNPGVDRERSDEALEEAPAWG